jgi:hypothetical protein
LIERPVHTEAEVQSVLSNFPADQMDGSLIQLLHRLLVPKPTRNRSFYTDEGLTPKDTYAIIGKFDKQG